MGRASYTESALGRSNQNRSQLGTRGERLDGSAIGGDVSIMSMEMTQDHRTLNTYYDNFGGGWGWRRWGGGFGDGFGTATTTEETYKVGTLVVDLFDTNAKKLIWRGSASDTLSDKFDKNIKKLNTDVQKMFDHFPPETGKGRL
jgi:Domain of unknown function (DUF4136)